MNQYTYDGPVMNFGTCISDQWHGTTYAVSEKKARSSGIAVLMGGKGNH